MVSRSSKFSHRHYDYRKVLLHKYLALLMDEELGIGRKRAHNLQQESRQKTNRE